jgi:hypothetical protein
MVRLAIFREGQRVPKKNNSSFVSKVRVIFLRQNSQNV